MSRQWTEDLQEEKEKVVCNSRQRKQYKAQYLRSQQAWSTQEAERRQEEGGSQGKSGER